MRSEQSVHSLINDFSLVINSENGQVLCRGEPFVPIMYVFSLIAMFKTENAVPTAHSGSASVDEDEDLILLDNGNGFSLHKMSTGIVVATYSVAKSRTSKPISVVFGENKSAVVTGSDEGSVLIFNRSGGSLVDILHHASHGLVQCITVCCPNTRVSYVSFAHRSIADL